MDHSKTRYEELCDLFVKIDDARRARGERIPVVEKMGPLTVTHYDTKSENDVIVAVPYDAPHGRR